MTIQQIFKKHANYTKLPDMDFDYMMDEEDFTNAAKELIEYHVQAALREASEFREPILLTDMRGNTKTTSRYYSNNITASLNKKQILTCYDLNLIK